MWHRHVTGFYRQKIDIFFWSDGPPLREIEGLKASTLCQRIGGLLRRAGFAIGYRNPYQPRQRKSHLLRIPLRPLYKSLYKFLSSWTAHDLLARVVPASSWKEKHGQERRWAQRIDISPPFPGLGDWLARRSAHGSQLSLNVGPHPVWSHISPDQRQHL
jgi:hypothetical protein